MSVVALPKRELEHRWASVGGRQLHYRAAGPERAAGSAAVVLVHGLLVSSRYLVPLGELLAPHCPVYIPDLPGYGLSDKPAAALDMAGLADALAGWMQAVALERAALVGNSMGCQIIAQFARRHAPALARAVWIGPTMDPANGGAVGQALHWLTDFPNEHPGMGLVLVRDIWDAGLSRLMQTYRYALADRIAEQAPHVQAPTLIISGTRDPAASIAWGDSLRRRLPQGRHVIVAGAPHTSNYSTPERLLPDILDFLGRPEALAA